jgi:hypothetical protein
MCKRVFSVVLVILLGLLKPVQAQENKDKISVNLIQVAQTGNVTSLHQWVVNRMISWLPPGRSLVKDAKETPEAGKQRYEEIANTLISVVYDPKEPSIFSGKYGRARTLALILSVAYFESGFRRDVDLGVGPLARGDNGQSWCMMQVMLGKPGLNGNTRTRIALYGNSYKMTSNPNEGWGGNELVTDREKCFRIGLNLIRKSFAACPKTPIEDRLSVYGAGKCLVNWAPSRYRVRKAYDWLTNDKPPLTDKEVMDILHGGIQTLPAPKS